MGLRPTRFAGCLLQGFNRGGLAVGGRNPRGSARRRANVPIPVKRSATCRDLPACSITRRAKRFFAFGSRLEECTRRQRHVGAPDAQQRLCALRHQLAVAGEPSELVGLGHLRQRCQPLRIERTGSAHISVEPAVSRRHLDVEWLSRASDCLRDRPCGAYGACKPGRQNGAIVDRDDVVRARGRETDLQNIVVPRRA